MDKKLKTKWLKALRSRRYKQGNGYLRSPFDGSFCCLGVLCDIQGADFDSSVFGKLYTETLPRKFNAGLKKEQRQHLASMNDDGISFGKIANYIEANL